MQIIHLGSNVGMPSQQAHAYQIMKMCEAMADHNVSLRLLHPSSAESGRELSGKDIFDYYGTCANFTMQAVPCLNLRTMFAKRAPNIWRSLRAMSFTLSTLIYSMRWWRDETTILYSRDRFTSYLLLLLSPLIKAKHIFEAHKFLAGRYSRIIIGLLRRLDTLVVTTRQLEQLYLDVGIPKKKLLHAPNGVDINHFQIDQTKNECRLKLGLPLDRSIVGYVGNFRNTLGMEKGIPELIEAMSILQRQSTNPPFLICVGGPSDYVPEYERLARHYKLNPEHYRFVDFVPRQWVPQWMKACDVLTIPWPWNSFSANETSPIKLCEYMASKVVIVASDLPSLRQILVPDKNSMLVEAGSAPSLANGLERVLTDNEFRKTLTRQAFDDVQIYSWSIRAGKILSSVDIQTL